MSDTSHIPEQPSEKAQRKDLWFRGLYMLLVLIMLEVAGTVLAVIAVIQFVWMLINGDKNDDLSRFGRSLGRWFKQAVAFQTCDTEEKPFPWNKWPSDQT